jgi:DNA-binding CsgD family transcriptional regulator
VIEKHVVRAKGFNRTIKGAVDLSCFGDIRLKEHRFAACITDHLNSFLALFDLNIQNTDFCPLFSEGKCSCPTYSGSSTGYDWADLSALFGSERFSAEESSLHKSVELTFLNFGDGLLTPRERQVVEFTLKGHSAEAVGRILEISPGTVRIHRRNVYSKLRIRSQGELFSKFIENLVGDEASQSK